MLISKRKNEKEINKKITEHELESFLLIIVLLIDKENNMNVNNQSILGRGVVGGGVHIILINTNI